MKHDHNKHPDNRARGAERRNLVSALRNQGRSLRWIGHELGWDEATIRRDLKILQLPSPQLTAILNGDTAEKYFQAAKLARVIREKQALADLEDRHYFALVAAESGRRLAEEKASGCHSSALKKHVLSWLKSKRLAPCDEQVVLRAPGTNSGDRQALARQDVQTVFTNCEFHTGNLPNDRDSRVDFYGDVLNSALLMLAPEREIRTQTLRKAMAEVTASNAKVTPASPLNRGYTLVRPNV